MPNSPTILLAGGGTGGHLYPGVAVAEALRQLLPESKVVFLCTNRPIDRVILDPTGFEFIPQPIVPPVKTVAGLLRFWKNWRETKDLVRRVLNERRPVAALGLGGYAAGVAIRVASADGIPCALLNPDVIPGKANQFLMQRAKVVCCQFEKTKRYVKAARRSKLRITGCPIRADIRTLPAREQAAARLSLDPMLRTLAVTGASLGAQTINEAVLTMLEGMTLNGWQILHLSGRDHADSVRAGYRELSVQARIIDFTPAMADVWAATDLAISRAGASSCAELTACGVPSVLMPYPFHKDMHQRANAKVLARAGAAALVDDCKDRRKNADALRPVIESLLYDGEKRQAMSESATKLGMPEAAENVARVLMGLIRGGGSAL